MDHHKCQGLSGTVQGFEDKYFSGRRPTGIYVPRFRNVNEKRKDYVRGFAYYGSASREGWQRDDEHIGMELKEALTRPGLWGMGFSGFGEGLPYPENRITLSPDKKDQWGRPTIVVDCEFKDNEKITLSSGDGSHDQDWL